MKSIRNDDILYDSESKPQVGVCGRLWCLYGGDFVCAFLKDISESFHADAYHHLLLEGAKVMNEIDHPEKVRHPVFYPYEVIDLYNLHWDEYPALGDARFKAAYDIVQSLFERYLYRRLKEFGVMHHVKMMITRAESSKDCEVLVIEKRIPSERLTDILRSTKLNDRIKFVVNASCEYDGFILQSLPISLFGEPRGEFPQEWDELNKYSKDRPQGMKFCSSGVGFAIFDSKDNAIAAAKEAIRLKAEYEKSERDGGNTHA